jgi:hypothetical protein
VNAEQIARELANPEDQVGQDRPSISWTPETSEQAVEDLNVLLAEPGATSPRIFQRCGRLVYVARLEAAQQRRSRGEVVSLRPAGSLSILPVSRELVSRLSESAIEFLAPDKRGKLRTAHAPVELIRRYCASAGLWRAPTLRGISALPLLRPNGTVIVARGFDPESSFWMEPNTIIRIPTQPTEADAAMAIARLGELIGTFPFETAADRSVMLAAMLTAVARHLADNVPAIGFSATTAGTGKTKLARIVNIMQTGRRAPAVISPSRSEEEWRKALFAFALAGEPCVLIDNIERPFGGATLNGAITASAVQDRQLGVSEQRSVPFDAIVLLTGNNLHLRGDMTRRVLVCRLDAEMEFPEERTFDSDPEMTAWERRGEVVGDALTVLAAYLLAGRPLSEPLPAFGSFEQWSRLVRGALAWLGEADPIEGMRRQRDEDPERQALAELMAAWAERFGSEPTTTMDAAAAAPANERLAQAIKECCRGEIDSAKLGYYLRRVKGRVIGRSRFTSRKGRVREWTLVGA